MFDFVVLHKSSIAGFGLCIWVSRRFNSNMKELEQNTQEKKLFDPLKAKAQIQVYKEIYNFDDKSQNEDGALRILKSADEKDLESINNYFQKQNDGMQDQSKIDQEMEKLKAEIDSLEEVTSGHQGFKFYRTIMTKDTFEDALIELREKEFEKKFMYDNEQLIGDKPKTV